ncbi:MAG: hypothetical protein ACYTGW_01865 [Planctomycetota bacterium]
MATRTSSIESLLSRKGANRERLAEKVIRDPGLLPQVFECLAMDKPALKYGASRILRILSEQTPELLYPRIPFFIDNLETKNTFLACDASLIVGNLSAVDSKKKIDKIFARYFAPIRGPNLIIAGNITKGAIAMARAKPWLTEDIVGELLKVEKGKYDTNECRNIAIGGVIETLNQIFVQLQRKRRVLNFVRRQLANSRPAVRKKAEKFLRRHVGTESSA